MSCGLRHTAAERRANAMQQLRLRQMPDHAGQRRGEATGRVLAREPERLRFRFDHMHETFAGTAENIQFRPPDNADTGCVRPRGAVDKWGHGGLARCAASVLYRDQATPVLSTRSANPGRPYEAQPRQQATLVTVPVAISWPPETAPACSGVSVTRTSRGCSVIDRFIGVSLSLRVAYAECQIRRRLSALRPHSIRALRAL